MTYEPPTVPEPTPSTPPSGEDRTQLYGILGIVLAVACCAPLGILFGWMSMNEAKKRGKDETLGKVAFWLGIAFTALAVLSTVFFLCLGGLGAFSGDITS